MLGRLGEGGMGAVYLAEAPDERLVAVKVIRPELAYQDEFRARFRSEVNRARQVPPFCTAEVLDADPEHETPYLVVEFVDGPSLGEVVAEQGPLTAGNLHSVAIGVATALTAIHGAGVIHRDLKPRNVLFSLGTPKVIDFGIARALEVTSQHTRTDQMVGTVAYMAPERFDSDNRVVGTAADVFAWGAVVAYAGTGRTPFSADSPAATAARILTQPPELSGLPRPLRDLVALTLAKEPEERPTAHELLDMLLSAGPQEALTLAERPALRRAAEAAQHSGRFSTGDRGRPGRTLRELSPVRRGRRIGLLIGAVLAVAGLSLYGTHLLSGSTDREKTDAAQLTIAPPAPRAVRGASVFDHLDRRGQWQPVREETESCTFDDRLIVSTDVGPMQCPGPPDSFSGDQSIAVDVAVTTDKTCALVWFRYTTAAGYRLSVCRDAMRLDIDDDGTETAVAAIAATMFGSGDTHRLKIDLRGATATFTVDDTPVFQAPVNDPSLRAGKVILGATTEVFTGDFPPVKVAFANAEIESL
jgi:predicted Ser/Thr protein kinase